LLLNQQTVFRSESTPLSRKFSGYFSSHFRPNITGSIFIFSQSMATNISQWTLDNCVNMVASLGFFGLVLTEPVHRLRLRHTEADSVSWSRRSTVTRTVTGLGQRLFDARHLRAAGPTATVCRVTNGAADRHTSDRTRHGAE
jgi:hypothetical protein